MEQLTSYKYVVRGSGDPDADPQIRRVGCHQEEIVATTVEGGPGLIGPGSIGPGSIRPGLILAGLVLAGRTAEQDDPGPALFVAAPNFPHDFDRPWAGQIHVQQSDRGRLGPFYARESFGPVVRHFDLIVPGLQGSSQKIG